MIERGSDWTDNRPPIVSQIWSQSSRLSNSSHEFRVGGLFQRCDYAWSRAQASKAQMETSTHIQAIDCRNNVPNVGCLLASQAPQHV